MTIRLKALHTSSEVIDALGGNTVVGKLISTADVERTTNHVSNYRRSGIFPPDSFLIMQAALRKKGYRAPARLWGIVDPKDARLRRAG